MNDNYFLIAESYNRRTGYIGQFMMSGEFSVDDLYEVNEILRRGWVKDG